MRWSSGSAPELRPTSSFPRWEVAFVLRTEKLGVVWHPILLGFTRLGAGRGGRTLTGLRPKVFESHSPDLLRVAPHQIKTLRLALSVPHQYFNRSRTQKSHRSIRNLAKPASLTRSSSAEESWP